jgi:hypothetical protein
MPAAWALVWVCLLGTPRLSAQEISLAQQDETQAQYPSPSARPQWLDEVRAQRQASEARREETRKALDARHRWIDPWGAAQREAREREIEQRRHALQERIEQEREQFRAGRPPLGGYPRTLALPAPGLQTSPPPAPEPLGWDNRWYYQGY